MQELEEEIWRPKKQPNKSKTKANPKAPQITKKQKAKNKTEKDIDYSCF